MRIRIATAIGLMAAAQLSFASLMYVGPVTGGGGLGSVDTILTLTSPGSSTTESGCVSSGAGGTTVTGVCPGNGPNGGNNFTGGDEQAVNNVISASSLGLTSFADLQLVFNASEPASNSITIDNLALTLWNPATGLILDAYYLDTPGLVIPDTDPGVGNAGFGFQLDPTQAATANGILAAFPNLVIGAALNASDAQGGLETLYVQNIGEGGGGGGGAVPEPSTIGLMAAGLGALAFLRRK